MRQAVILAGGKGTRLQSRLQGRPKPLIEIDGVPLLRRQVELLVRHGFGRVTILVSHMAGQIVDYCAAHGNFGIELEFVDDGEPRGTAGAVLAVLKRLEEEFLVVYGDTMLDVDLGRFWEFHRGHGAAASLFLHPNDHPHDSDLVEVDDGGIVRQFHPYPHSEGAYFRNLVNAALYVIQREALAGFVTLPPPLDFAKDLFPRMLEAGMRISGYASPEYIKDAGTPDRLDKVTRDVRSGRVARSNLAVRQGGVFVDRDGTLIHDPGHLASPDQVRLLEGIGPALKRLNLEGIRTALVTNQPVLARGECSFETLETIHAKLEWDLAMFGAYLDRIYVCPHHPDRGFPGEVAALKIECDCRKPKPGMLLRGARDLNVDLSKSWMIGDTSADAGAAAEAGATSILVQTGSAGYDEKYPHHPDFACASFAHAVDFIIRGYPRAVASASALLDAPPERLLFVGGLSRAGKSTLAGVLAREWRGAGRTVHVIRLDDWLRDAELRQSGVYGRYDISDMEGVVQALRRATGSVEFDVPMYSRLQRRRRGSRRQVIESPEAVCIFEGVAAVELARRAGMLELAVHVETLEAGRRHRVIREYEIRGGREDGARIYEERQGDEFEVIEAAGALAAWRVSLDAAFA